MDFHGPRERASELQEAVRELGSCVRPISIIEQGTAGKRFTGSALIVAASDRRIVITAEHVVSGAETKFLGVSEAGGVDWPKDYFRLEPVDQAQSTLDIALAIADTGIHAEKTEAARPALPRATL